MVGRRKVLFLWVVCICVLLASGCGEKKFKPLVEGETYLEGSWYQEALRVGYNLFPDGGGYQIIGQTDGDRVFPIRYGIVRDRIYIQTIGEETVSFSFREEEDAILIEGLTYVKIPPDEEYEASVRAILSQEAEKQNEEQRSAPPKALLWGISILLAMILAVGFVSKYGRFLPFFKKR